MCTCIFNNVDVFSIAETIATIAMAYLTYKTLKFYADQHHSSRKQHIHDELRNAILRLKDSINIVELNRLKQEVYDGDSEEALRNVLEIERRFNNAAANLEYVLRDRECIMGDDSSSAVIDELNKHITPYIDYLGFLEQYANLREGIKNNRYGEYRQADIVEMQDRNTLFYEALKDAKRLSEKALQDAMREPMVSLYKKVEASKLDSFLSHFYRHDGWQTIE